MTHPKKDPTMRRYFFDVHDGVLTRDEEGIALADHEAVRNAAMKILPAIAADEIPIDGDRRHFIVLVRNDESLPVYCATLTFTGVWLQR